MKPQLKGALIAGATAVAVAVMFTPSRPISAQLGDVGFGRDPNPPYLQTGSMIVVVSPDNRSVAAFSTHTGVWRKQAVKAADGEKVVPTLTSEIACFQAGDKLYAFSAPKGAWQSVDLEPGFKAEPAVTAGMVIAHVGDKLYAFSATAGSWDSVEIASKR